MNLDLTRPEAHALEALAAVWLAEDHYNLEKYAEIRGHLETGLAKLTAALEQKETAPPAQSEAEKARKLEAYKNHLETDPIERLGVLYADTLETYRANGKNDFDAGRVDGIKQALELLNKAAP